MDINIKSSREVVSEHDHYIFPAVKPYYREPLAIAEAEGVNVTDMEGRRYLDLFAGILTTSLGHCHPEVVARVQAQVARLGHTSTLYLTENQVRVARHLAELAPGQLNKSFFVNSGSEAVETAIMLACIYTGRSEVVALRHAYAGRSFLTTNITGQAPWRPLPTTFPGIKHAMAPYPYRSPFGEQSDEDAAQAFAHDLEEVIETTTSGRPAAFIAEPIQGVGGFIVPPQGYFQRAAEIIHRHGGLFIADEVQTGFGRTGERWFGIEHWDVVPDIMVTAKGIAGGFPVGAVTSTDEIAASWTAKTISTYGGNPISMAATEATLEVMRREETPSRAASRGKQLRCGLETMFEKHAWIGEVRGMGLMQALEIVQDRQSKTPDPERAKLLLEAAKEQGVLIGLGGLHGHVIRLGPSMLISEAEVSEGLGRLQRACEQVEQQG